MTKRCIGIAGVILLTIMIGVWMALPKHRGPSGSQASGPVADMPVHASQVPGAFAPIKKVDELSSAASTDSDGNFNSVMPIANAEESGVDRDFAVVAARTHVEEYQRNHPMLKVDSFGWNQAKVVYVPGSKGGDAKGYLAVFFPVSDGSGDGFSCFKVNRDLDHLEPLSWGYAPDVVLAIENLRRDAQGSNGCTHLL